MAETTKAAAKKRPGFNDEGKPFPGVHAESGERMAVTLKGLQDEFGDKRGEAMFAKIAEAGGYGRASDLATDASLDLTGLRGKAKEEVSIILGEG